MQVIQPLTKQHIRSVLIILSAIALLLMTVAPATAEMVRVVGRAAYVDGDPSVAPRRALEDALYLAALEGGADVSGFSITNQGVLTGDSILIQPTYRILDYSILHEGSSGPHYEVTIEAYVGEAPDLGCTLRPVVQLVAGRPQIHATQTAPLWATEALEEAHDQTLRNLEAVKTVQIVSRDISFAPTQNAQSNIPNGFDYQALLTGKSTTPVQTVPDQARGLHLSWHATAPAVNARNMTVTLKAQIIDPTAPTRAREGSMSQTVAISPNTPWRALNVLARKDARAIAQIIAKQAGDELAAWLSNYSCAPLKSLLVADGNGRFRVDLGARDGLTWQSLAFVEGHGQPWTVLRVLELTASSAIVSPLNPSRAAQRLNGAPVRFEIGG
jgi:hypothetical protein